MTVIVTRLTVAPDGTISAAALLPAGEHAASIEVEDRPTRRDQSPEAVAARLARMDRIVREIAAMPILDPRSPDDIMDDLNAV